jgi:predicted thioesterase
MKNPFTPGDGKEYRKTVSDQDLATFETGTVHPFYGTFALARDAEWASRLFVLDMIDDDEEGIGTYIQINHMTPATLNEEVVIEATLDKVERNNVSCSIRVRVEDRVVAVGRSGQKILKKEKLNQLIAKFSG